MEDGQWMDALRADGVTREAALADLHLLLRRAAHREVGRRAVRHGWGASEVDDLAEQAADDAMVAVLAKLDRFRGDSRFTTWAYAFVVLEVSAAVGRRRRDVDLRLDTEQWATLPDRWGAGPSEIAQARELVDLLRHAADTVLTPHQRKVFVAVVVDAVPLDVLTVELGTTRDAIYGTVYDARRKLRALFAERGYLLATTTGAPR